ncbi:MAG: transglutaminase family protein [Candidatus Gastranaerophilaceae bacterium]
MKNADGFDKDEFVFDDDWENKNNINTSKNSVDEEFIFDDDFGKKEQKTKTSKKSTDEEFVFDENFEKDFKKQRNMKVLAIFVSVIIVTVFSCLLFLKPKNNTAINTKAVGIKPPVTSEYRARPVADKNLIARIPPKQTNFVPNEKFKFSISRTIKFSGNMTDVDFSFEVPSDIVNRQKIYELNVIPKPSKIVRSGDRTIAHIFLKNPPKNFTFTINGIASVNTYNLAQAERTNKNFDEVLSGYEREKYLRSEDRINSQNELIRTAAAKIPNSQTEADTVKNIFDFVVSHMKYNIKDANDVKGSVQALQTGTGICEEFADLFVALCRAKGIPARTVAGCDLPFVNYSLAYNNGHKWCEVYFDNYGWVLFDPTNNLDKKIFARFGKLPYEILSQMFKNHLYFKVDVQAVEVTHSGNGDGNIISSNPDFKFSKI